MLRIYKLFKSPMVVTERIEWSKSKKDECSVFSNSRRSARGCSKTAAISEYQIPCARSGKHFMRHVWRLRDTKKRQIMTAVDGSNLNVTTQFRAKKKKRTSCNRRLNAKPSTQRKAVNSTQGRQLNARPSTQRRQLNIGPSAEYRDVWPSTWAVSSKLQGRQRSAKPSTQGRRLNAKLSC